MVACAPVKITSGAYWKPLPDALAYEATIPLTYQTKWHSLAKDMSSTLGNCGKLGAQICEMGETLQTLMSHTKKHLLSIDTAIDPSSYSYFSYTNRNKRSLDFIGDGLSWCCGVATQHKLDSLVLNEAQLRKKLERVNSGLDHVLQNIASNSQAFKNYSDSMAITIDTIQEKIYQLARMQKDENKKIANLSSELDESTLYLINLLFHSVQNSVLSAHALHNSEIMQDCRSHKIPNLIVIPKVLKVDLKRLNTILSDSNQELAIPLSDISKYYKLPLCDCVISNSDLTIHIRIPITQKGSTWKLYELLTTPFAWNNETCVIMHDTMYLAVSETSTDGNLAMRPVSGTGLHNCKPYEHRLCYIPRFSADNTYGPQCAFSMYQGASVKELASVCAFRCHSSRALVISEVQEDTYVITHPKPKTAVNCDSDTYPILESALDQPGALQVTLPCHCSLTMRNISLIPKRFPCSRIGAPKQGIIHVLPATWSNLKSLHLKPLEAQSHPIFHNLTDCIDTNWTLNVPHLNLSTDSLKNDLTVQLSESLESLEDLSSHLSTHGDRLMVIWNILLSLGIVYLVRKNRLLAVSLEVLRARSASAETDGLKPADKTFIIILVCVITYACVVTGWLLHALYKRFCNKTRTIPENCQEQEEQVNLRTLHPVVTPKVKKELTDPGNRSV